MNVTWQLPKKSAWRTTKYSCSHDSSVATRQAQARTRRRSTCPRPTATSCRRATAARSWPRAEGIHGTSSTAPGSSKHISSGVYDGDDSSDGEYELNHDFQLLPATENPADCFTKHKLTANGPYLEDEDRVQQRAIITLGDDSSPEHEPEPEPEPEVESQDETGTEVWARYTSLKSLRWASTSRTSTTTSATHSH